MTNQPPKTQISQFVTQALQTIQAKVNFGALSLKKGAKVAEIQIQSAEGKPPEIYPLLGDRYLAGRSSKSCDIVIRNPIVSQTHFSLERDKKKPSHFIIKDERSTNGIFLGKRRLKSLPLRHGDLVTLGPPELQDVVTVKFHNPPSWWVLAIRYFLYGSGGLLGLILLILGVEWSKVDVSRLDGRNVTGPNIVYSRDGQTPLRPLTNQTHKELDKLDDFSENLINALIASEDSRYYWHLGVDPYGIARAIVVNMKKGGVREGASTITQQLARSIFAEVGRDNSAGRKIKEMIVALKLELFYSKNTLLKTYLNRVYLGVNSYGFEDAAQFYFDKSAADLTVSEAATLVASLPAPNKYNPVQDYQTSVKLRNRVIDRMEKLGMISTEEASRARRSRIEISPKARQTLSSTIAPYFYDYVFTELNALLGSDVAKEGNFIIETSLDINTQKKAETALKEAVNSAGSTYKFSQGALVTLNSSTGEILALVGGTDYGKSQFNRAIQAHRQPGSTFKVFGYAAAIEAGISPYKAYSCEGLRWEGQSYKPCERSSGSIDMYRGLAQSENAIALRVARDVGLDKVVEMAQSLGVNSSLKAVPGLILGQSEVNVLEITGSYAAFANNGIWSRPHAINRILDGNDCQDYRNPQTCREIYNMKTDQNLQRQVISPSLANTMTSMMRGTIQGGTGRSAYIGLGEAGKTGTTNQGVDLWFIGYVTSRQRVTGIWLGNDDNSPTRGSSGQAAQLWGSYMRKILQ